MIRNLVSRYGIYIVLLTGMVLRLQLLLQDRQMPLKGDEGEYYRLAQTIVTGWSAYQNTFRPPLYPVFLAFSFPVFGESRFTIGFLQVLLAALSICVIYTLAQILFQRRSVAVLTAFIFAIYPDLVPLPRLGYSETIFILLLCLSFVLLLRSRRTKQLFPILCAGVLLALAALTRELIAYFAILIIPIWLFICAAPHWKDGFWPSVALWTGLALVLAPWVVRNWQIESRLLLVASSGEFQFARDNIRIAPLLSPLESSIDRKKLKEETSNSRVTRALRKELAQIPSATRGSYALNRGLAVINLAPGMWLLIKSVQTRELWKPSQADSNFIRIDEDNGALATFFPELAVFSLIVLLGSATVGLFAARDNAPKLLFLLFILYSLIVFLATHYQPRYRVPLLVLLMPYSAFGLSLLADAIRSRRLNAAGWADKRVYALGSLLVLFAVLVLT